METCKEDSMTDSNKETQVLTQESVSLPTKVLCLPQHQQELSLVKNTVPPPSGPIQIILDESEQCLFDVLVGTVNAYNKGQLSIPNDNEDVSSSSSHNNNNDNNHNVTSPSDAKSLLEIRVAGGWVRDKVLGGLTTHDVDIAVTTMTGVQFAKLVQLYIQLQQQQDSSSNANSSSLVSAGKIGVIAANPAQSKHLETATMKVCGIEVDFCNLRAQETYDHHSRIPTVTFGTPLEDAQRRDFTMNALFYNLHTQMIEDWTQRGIHDLLVKGILVTPLDPVQTFRDDPLRVLRAIRFAIRYQFVLDLALEEAAQQSDIHRALHIKVSRERVGKELEGMLSGKGADPIAALRLISHLKLAGSVFSLPVPGQGNVTQVFGFIHNQPYHSTTTEEEEEEGFNDSPEARQVRAAGWEESLALLDVLESVWKAHNDMMASNHDLGYQSETTQVDCRLLPLAVFLLPFRKLVHDNVKKAGKEFSAVAFVIREGLKFKNQDVYIMTTLMENVDSMVDFLTNQHATQTTAHDGKYRLQAGLLLRATKDNWVTCLLLATVVMLRQQQQEEEGSERIDWIQIYQDVYHSIHSLQLDHCWKMKPLLDGSAIIKALQLPRGPTVGTYLEEQVRWMLLYPKGTRNECEAHLLAVKQRREEENEKETVEANSDATTNARIPGVKARKIE